MSVKDIGELLPADESLTHQIVDTFAVVQQADRSWTEKLWLALSSPDGSLTVDLGIGKYTNRNVLDGFGGVSRGHEQWTVRGSRELSSAPDRTEVGPIHYEVVEPLKRIRARLDENEHQPIAFDLLLEGVIQPNFEERARWRQNNRVENDVIRYHQLVTARGWVSIDGERTEATDWFGARDHSWGVRTQVGDVPGDLQPVPPRRGGRTYMYWTPWLLTRPDGTSYEIMQYIMTNEAHPYYSGHVSHADGTQETILRAAVVPTFDPGTRLVRSATFTLHLESGEVKTVTTEALGESGFHLTTAGYGGWAGSRHGRWRGELHVDGDHVEDTVKHPEIGSLRDRPVRVTEGEAVGFGIQESFYAGQWPEYGIGPDVPETRIT